MIGFLPFIGIWGYHALMKVTAENRVSNICVAFTPGLDVEAAARIADAHGMEMASIGSVGYFAGDKATSNLYGCRLEFRNGVLQGAMYFTYAKK